MRRRSTPLRIAATTFIFAISQPLLAPPSLVAAPGPGSVVNDTARLIAGMPVSEASPLAPIMRDPAWQAHAALFEKAFAKVRERELNRIHKWEGQYLPEGLRPMPVAYYMFSGPDLFYVDQFFPNASVYVLSGQEPVGPLPDLQRIAQTGGLPVALNNLAVAMKSALSLSFFITKDMRSDLQRGELRGTLPIFYIFLARAEKTINEVSFVSLSSDGTFRPTGAGKSGGASGVRIAYTDPNGRPQTMFYFTTDLSDGGIKSSPGFMKFCKRFGNGASLLKSASYLMHGPGFSTVRSFLLEHSTTIVQDDSAIPISYFDPNRWSLRFFGEYNGPVPTFKQFSQPQLAEIYARSNPASLHFGFGYREHGHDSTLIVAQRN